MDAMLFRTLLARGEGRHLDYKQDFIEPFKLVRCILAIANGLRREQVGHILLGVGEAPDGTGVPVGVDPSRHPNDADVHGWVRDLLNDVPEFSYSVYEEDGRSFGVVKIVGNGRRPFFPLKDKEPKHQMGLRRNIALYREGSRTDVVPPDVIAEWWREDHGWQDRLAELSYLQQQAALKPLIELRYRHHDHYSDLAIASQHPHPPFLNLYLDLMNFGNCPVRILDFEATWHLISSPSRFTGCELAPFERMKLGQVLAPMYDHELTMRLEPQAAHSLADPSRYPALSDLELRARVRAMSVPFQHEEPIEFAPIRLPVRA